MNEHEENNALERRIQRAYDEIQVDPVFAARLRGQIAGQPDRRDGRTRWPRLSLRLAIVGAAIVLVLAAVLAVGPEPLLARARALFSFIPGVGFVEEPNAYHLCQPVGTSMDGIELSIERGGGSTGDLHIAGTITGLETPPFQFHLEDEAGQPVRANGGGGGGGGGGGESGKPAVTSFDFDFNLPEIRSKYVFVVQAFEQTDTILRLPFELCPGAESTAQNPDGQAQEIYTPEKATASGKGIGILLMKVAQNAQATGLQLKTTTENDKPGYRASVPDFYIDPEKGVVPNLTLTDDQGRAYAQHPLHLLNSTSDPADSTLEFDPLAADVKKVSLRIHSMMLLFDESVPFNFAVTDEVKNGQPVDLKGEIYRLNAFEMKMIRAVYARENVQTGPDEYKNAETVEFTMQVTTLDTQMDLFAVCPTIELPNAGYQCSPEEGTGLWKLKLIFTDGIPAQGIQGTIGHISADLTGPWEVSWNVPGK